MYNEDKKLITEITRGNNTKENLKAYADRVKTVDFEYACQKFTLNYITIKEMLEDKDISDDPFIYETITAVNKLIGLYVTGDKTPVLDEDLQLINGIRNRITAKMKVLTAYTDAFELYEYILNRKEFGYEENADWELEEEFSNFDAEEFGAKIFSYIFKDNDNVVVNSKIQSVVAQLPMRMTKNKFYDIIGQTLAIYKDCETGALDEFVDTVETTALIKKPEGFETEYDFLFDAYTKLLNMDPGAMTYEEYSRMADILNKSAAFLNDIVSDYLMLMEIVNDLYAMLICNDIKSDIGYNCKRAIGIIKLVYDALSADEDMPSELYDLLLENEGAQEEAGENKLILDGAAYDIIQANTDKISAFGYDKLYRDIDKLEKLLSGSLFVDIDNIAIYNTNPCTTEYIIALKDRLCSEFGDLFKEQKAMMRRAVMAKVLSNIPVFFNSQQEIKDYIVNSLSACSNSSELKAVYMVISDMLIE